MKTLKLKQSQFFLATLNITILIFVGLFMLSSMSPKSRPNDNPFQDKLTGYQYLLSTGASTPFKYSKSYSNSGDLFITTYKIYHPIKNTHVLTITATHYKSEKRVVVLVEDPNGGIFSEINKEETKYESSSLEPFGYRGSVSGLGGNKIPNQLSVKFASLKFENVNVLNVAGSHENNDFEFFVLDGKK